MTTPHIGKRCIIRAYASGVHFGTLAAQDGRQVELTDARRLWRWYAKDGISLSEVSQNGIVAKESRIAQAVPSIGAVVGQAVGGNSDWTAYGAAHGAAAGAASTDTELARGGPRRIVDRCLASRGHAVLSDAGRG